MPFFDIHSHRLSYRETGTGPLLLILPGNTASSAWHEGELHYFSRHYHAVSLDFLGTGQSDRMQVWPDDWWEQGAHDAAGLIRYLGASQAIVMGTSGGAIVALLAAILHPEQVLAVVADSTVEVFPTPVLSRAVQERSRYTEGQIEFWQQAHGEDWEQVVAADSDFLLRFEQAGGDCFRGRLHEVRCPILLSGSLEDESLPDVEAQMHRMAQQIVDCRLFLSPQGSHPLMWSRADDFRREAEAFLTTIQMVE